MFNQHFTDNCSNPTGTWFGVWDVLTFHADEQQNLVQTILNGFDVTSHFYYQPLTELASPVYTMGHYIKGTGAQFPVYDYQGPLYVVNRSNRTDPSGDMLDDMEYKYWGAKVHRQGRGFLTFAKTDAIEKATLFHHIVTSDYDLNYFYPIITETKQESHWGANVDPHFKTTLINDKLNLGNNTFFPYVNSSETVDYLTHVTVHHDFDYLTYSDGNLYSDHLTTSNLISANNFDVVTNYTYGKYPTSIHCNNKLTNSVTVTTYPGGQNPYTVEKNYNYDQNTGNLTLDKTSSGTNGAFVETQYYYVANGCGTIDHKIKNGSQNSNSGWASPVPAPDPITTTYFYNTKHRFVSSSKNTLGQIIDYSYDGTGNIMFVHDIDGLTDGFRYDAFGREESRTPKRHNLPGSTLGEIKTD